MNSDEFCLKLKKLLNEKEALSVADIMQIKKDLRSLNLTTASESPVWAPGLVYVKEIDGL